MNGSKDSRNHPVLRGPSATRAPDDVADDADDDGLELKGVKGKIRKKTIDRFGKIVDDHPDEALSALRRWLHE